MAYKKPTKRVDAIQVFSDKIAEAIDKMNEGEKPSWIKPWRDLDYNPRNMVHNNHYSGLYNVFSCMVSGHNDPRYLTFNQIRKLKGKLKKGSKCVPIIFWKFFKNTDKDTGEEKSIPFARYYPAFNVEDVEGIEIPALDKNTNNDIVANEVITDMIKKLKVEINENGNSAHYIPSRDDITLPRLSQFNNVDEWSAVVLHELVHWTGSKNRLNRDVSEYHNNKAVRSREELVAELGAMRLCQKLNINGFTDKNHLSYIKGWGQHIKDDKKFVYSACKEAEKAANYILDNAGIKTNETNNVEEKEAA